MNKTAKIVPHYQFNWLIALIMHYWQIHEIYVYIKEATKYHRLEAPFCTRAANFDSKFNIIEEAFR